ncbi:MAG: nicotinamide-nucleotide amidase [Gammaproteobacteria bacterium]
MSDFEKQIDDLATKLGKLAKQDNVLIAVAESCTGGWLAQSITSISGSSAWFERGFVTYTNIAKQEMLGVLEETLAQFGAVSKQVASEMAGGALVHSHAQISVSITGIAGPDGGTEDKPVGTVCFAVARDNEKVISTRMVFEGDRNLVRQLAVVTALQLLIKSIS